MIRPRRIFSAVAAALRLFSFSFLIPVPIALLYEPHTVPFLGGLQVPGTVAPFLTSFLLSVLVWVPVRLATRSAQDEDLSDREGVLAIGLGWLAATFLATLPFTFTGHTGSPVDAWFEAMSGFTGTASTTLSGYPALPESLVFWRILLSWMGGLAILVLTVALLSRLTHGAMPTMQGSGVSGGARLKPKLTEAARGLWLMYLAVTAVIALLLAALLWRRHGLDVMPALFQGLVQAMGAYSSGGISDPGGPWPGAGDWAVDGLLVAAMLLGATNFALVFGVLRKGDLRKPLRNPEWRMFAGAYVVAAAVVALLLVRAGRPIAYALHHGAYAIASLYSGTGTWAVDYAAWPTAALLVLLLAMLAGGSSASTAGGIKAFRWLILGKLVLRELRKILHPKAVVPVRLGSSVVKEEAVAAVMAFFFTYLALWTAGTIALLALEPALDATVSAAASASALGNVGGGFGELGPTHGYAHLVPAAKLVLTALMFLGRLEIFAALILVNPLSWRT
ncbi:MAG TPA: potassium transporter TrkG [Candidatus Thermoplasmatota archaeon]|nr:potassium transporter TrkG [Candidatus Thermoplasmatota archaeon]